MRTATCDQCGFSGGIDAVRVHDCHVQEMGGRCDDYPCCGHVDGDGCQTRPEHTSAYWMEIMGDPARAHLAYEPGSPEWYDAMEQMDEEAGW